MSSIRIKDASDNNIRGLSFGSHGGVGVATIPETPAPSEGWYRIATIDPSNDLTDVKEHGYSSVVLIGNGRYSSPVPSHFTAIITFGNSSIVPAVTWLEAFKGSGIKRIRVGAYASKRVIDVYNAYTGTGSFGAFDVMTLGTSGALSVKSPAEKLDNSLAPTTTYMDVEIGERFISVPSTASPITFTPQAIKNGGANNAYFIFARLKKIENGSASSFTALVTGAGNFVSVSLGTYLVHAAVRSDGALHMHIDELNSVYIDYEPRFGYYFDSNDGMYYIGVKVTNYSARPTVIELNRYVTVGNGNTVVSDWGLYSASNPPSGWTQIDYNLYTKKYRVRTPLIEDAGTGHAGTWILFTENGMATMRVTIPKGTNYSTLTTIGTITDTNFCPRADIPGIATSITSESITGANHVAGVYVRSDGRIQIGTNGATSGGEVVTAIWPLRTIINQLI